MIFHYIFFFISICIIKLFFVSCTRLYEYACISRVICHLRTSYKLLYSIFGGNMKTTALLPYRTYSIGTCSKEIFLTDIMGRNIVHDRFDIGKGVHHYMYATENLLSGNYFFSINILNKRYTYPLSIIK